MCGFVGLASRDAIRSRAWLIEGRDAIAHRGPNDAGEWWSNCSRVGLAHRRLSILDLSPLGHQPMRFPELGLTIVFNGEIYNYIELKKQLSLGLYGSALAETSPRCGEFGAKWIGTSDTEVILAAYVKWGTDCLSRLNGMFAFAIYDDRNQQLFLARDRGGEKPLFYHIENGTLSFASELKALLANSALPRRIDAEALDCYLTMGFVPGERCILKGFRKLPPGHAMTFDLRCGTHRVWCWWRLPQLEDRGGGHQLEEDLVDELEILLEDAVAKQLQADVPVGILLSGGTDSSLVTAMAVRNSTNVRTFTIGFPGAGKLDETEHARLIAKHYGTEHLELTAEPASADLIPLLAHQFDEPIVDSSMIPTFLVSRLVREHCTVALGGDGGDELFGGYEHYSRLLWMQQHIGALPVSLRRLVARGAERLLPPGVKGRNYLQNIDIDFQHGLPLIAVYFDATTRRRLMRGHLSHPLIADRISDERIPSQSDLLQRATRMDFENYLSGDILVKVDRSSMLNSLEIRAPFLDVRLLEFAFGKVPSRLKATVGDKKILLKQLAARVLPPQFDRLRKQGFSIPLADWLKAGPFRELFWDTLTASDSLFDPRTVHSLLNGQDRGFNNGERLFALVQFELWRKFYRVTL